MARFQLSRDWNEDNIFRLICKPNALTLDAALSAVLINLVDRIGEYIVQQTRHWQTVESFTTGSIEYNCTPYGVPSVNRLTSLAPWPTI